MKVQDLVEVFKSIVNESSSLVTKGVGLYLQLYQIIFKLQKQKMHKLKTFVKSLTSQTSDKKQQSSSSGESVAVVKSEHDMHWGLARVALHTVPTDVNSIAYDGVQVRRTFRVDVVF